MLLLVGFTFPGITLGWAFSSEKEWLAYLSIIVTLALEILLLSKGFYLIKLAKSNSLLSALQEELTELLKQNNLDDDPSTLRVWWAKCAIKLRSLDLPGAIPSLAFLQLHQPSNTHLRPHELGLLYKEFLESIPVSQLALHYSRLRTENDSSKMLAFTDEYYDATARVLSVMRGHRIGNIE